jgi:ssRNA-specific RNase YbeY (16S rRNA maturation enzyme)
MLKEMLIVLGILFVVSGGLITFYYTNLKAEQEQLIIQTNEVESMEVKTQLSMFMDSMRFDKNNLSYSFVECNEKMKDRMKKAFRIVSNETGVLYFYESENPEILIYCSEQTKEQRNTTYVAGEGGPNKVILSDLYSLIIDGKIYLHEMKRESCEYPIVEIHELLHVFGFDHINNKSKVLYPYINCQQRITEDIISELQRIYSEKPLADINLKNLSATTHGTYLDFEITVQNRGLIKAENIILEISANNKTVETLEIENLTPGISQTIKAKNLFVKSLNIKQVKFKVNTSTEEYFQNNNQLVAITN